MHCGDFLNSFPLLLVNVFNFGLTVRGRGDNMSDVKPDFVVRVVKDVGGKDRWTDVGVAYRNARGSITIYLSALPLNDKMLLIPSKGE